MLELWHRATIHSMEEVESSVVATDEAAAATDETHEQKKLNADDDGEHGSILERYVKKKRYRCFVDVLWPVMSAYGEGLISQLGWCNVFILAFDGVWLGFDEVFKILAYCPEANAGGWLHDQVHEL